MSNSFKSVISSDSFFYKILLTGFVIVFLYLFNQFSQNGRYIKSESAVTDSRTGDLYQAKYIYDDYENIKYTYYKFRRFGPGVSHVEMEKWYNDTK